MAFRRGSLLNRSELDSDGAADWFTVDEVVIMTDKTHSEIEHDIGEEILSATRSPSGWLVLGRDVVNYAYEHCEGRCFLLYLEYAPESRANYRAEMLASVMEVRERDRLRLTTDKDEDVVYFIYAEIASVIKIGKASDVTRRLKELRTMSPVPLQLLATIHGSYGLEGAIHEKFSYLRSHGEWFNSSPELWEFIEEHGVPRSDPRSDQVA